MLTLRPMRPDDLELVKTWLAQPGVAEWYLAGSTLEEQLEDLRDSINGREPTEVLLVSAQDGPIGWCQWYFCADYPEHAAGVGAGPGDVGIDYAIGETARWGRGLGTELIAALVGYIGYRYPKAGIIADPEASNVASRRVLEKNGFELLAERSVASEPTQAPVAIYRLKSQQSGRAAGAS